MIHRPGAKIRVSLGQPPSGAPDGFVSSPPVAFVNVTLPESDYRGGETYAALIDTGTDFTVIDKSVASRLKAELKGNGVGRGIGGFEAGIQYAHINVWLPSANVLFEVPQAAVIDLRGRGSPFDMIFGRDFLSHCRLSVDGPNAAYDLEWIDPSPST